MTGYTPILKSFGRAFPKARAVEAAEASSRSAERETLAAFSLITFFCAYGVKRKWLRSLASRQTVQKQKNPYDYAAEQREEIERLLSK